MSSKVDSPLDKACVTPGDLLLDAASMRYPKRKREEVRYCESDTDEYASSDSEDDHVPIKKVIFCVPRTDFSCADK